MAWIPLKNKNIQIRDILNGTHLPHAQPRPKVARYRNAFGPPASLALSSMIADHHLAAGINANWTKGNCLDTADALLDLEWAHGTGARARVAGLANGVMAGTLHNGVAANIKPLASYGAIVGDTNQMKAAKWIVDCSGSLNHGAHDVAMDNTLGVIINNGIGRTMGGLSAINHSLNFAPGPPPNRYIDTGGGILPAPPTGVAILQQNVTTAMSDYVPATPNQWIALACYYFGSIIRCHGFPDQNGRTGRTLYALCHLWGGVPFQAITTAFEDTLSELP